MLHGLEQPNYWFPFPTQIWKYYVNAVNAISTFVEPTPTNNIITNETIPTQYIIKQGLKVFGKKGQAEV